MEPDFDMYRGETQCFKGRMKGRTDRGESEVGSGKVLIVCLRLMETLDVFKKKCDMI